MTKLGLSRTQSKPEKSTFWVHHTSKHRLRKICKIHTRFDLHSATAFGGAAGRIDFVLQTGIDKNFRTSELRKRKDARFQMDDVALTFLLGSLLGQERVFHFEDIEQDPLPTPKLDLPKLPDTTLLHKDLKWMGSSAGLKAFRSAQRQILKSLLPQGRDIVLDIDSSVETVFGHQEQSAVGLNPHHHRRANFIPCWSLTRRQVSASMTNYVLVTRTQQTGLQTSTRR